MPYRLVGFSFAAAVERPADHGRDARICAWADLAGRYRACHRVVGADVGATKIKVGVANLLGDVIAETEIESGPNAEAVLSSISNVARDLQRTIGCEVEAACVGVPGVYRPASDAVFQALNLPGFDGLKIRTRLEEALGVDV